MLYRICPSMCSIRIFIWSICLWPTGFRCFLMILLNTMVPTPPLRFSFQGYWMRLLLRIPIRIPFLSLDLLPPLALRIQWFKTGFMAIRKTQTCRCFFLSIWNFYLTFLLEMLGIFWFIWIFYLVAVQSVLIRTICIYRSAKISFY